jgi:adenylate cyclase
MAMQFRLGNFAYMLVFIALTALTYHPFMAFWTAISAIAAWAVATLMALGEDGVYTILDLGRFQAMDTATLRATLLDPFYLSAVERAQEALLALVLAGIVALACGRARALVRREIESSAERANLARYFSPDLVGSLARGSALVGATARTEAAILFADIVGFTRFAERLPPEAVIDVLRAFHGRMAEAVFAHGGTLHKFLGDGLMASFGVTDGFVGGPRKVAAARALDCLVAVHRSMAAWNREREALGEPPLNVAIGIHYGPVVTGDVGDARCLEFAVLGDTVNVASRLEGLCRPLDAAAIISREAAAAAGAHPALAAFMPVAGETGLRGREMPLALLRLPREVGL